MNRARWLVETAAGDQFGFASKLNPDSCRIYASLAKTAFGALFVARNDLVQTIVIPKKIFLICAFDEDAIAQRQKMLISHDLTFCIARA